MMDSSPFRIIYPLAEINKSKRTKVVARIFGGLGNQLFIYAAARRLALVNNAELVLDNVSGFVWDKKYNRNYQLDHFNIPCRKASASERLEPLSPVRRYLKRLWNHWLPFERRTYIVQENIDYDPRILQVKIKGTVYLEGYWQGEGYFKDVEERIREDLTIQPPQDDLNQRMAEKIRGENAVAVHMRFFDMPGRQSDEGYPNNAPYDYYRHAIEIMEMKLSNAQYFLFSDQPNEARNLIPLSSDRLILVHHNQGDCKAYADLWLMSQCRHFIIANSTFSWWGAWLATNQDKIIIAPGFEKRDGKMWWGFKGLFPESWITI